MTRKNVCVCVCLSFRVPLFTTIFPHRFTTVTSWISLLYKIINHVPPNADLSIYMVPGSTVLNVGTIEGKHLHFKGSSLFHEQMRNVHEVCRCKSFTDADDA